MVLSFPEEGNGCTERHTDAGKISCELSLLERGMGMRPCERRQGLDMLKQVWEVREDMTMLFFLQTKCNVHVKAQPQTTFWLIPRNEDGPSKAIGRVEWPQSGCESRVIQVYCRVIRPYSGLFSWPLSRGLSSEWIIPLSVRASVPLLGEAQNLWFRTTLSEISENHVCILLYNT